MRDLGGRAASASDRVETRRPSRIRADIEGLRAVATFLVLPYHAGLMLFPGGFVGVDVFFVISGFVITGQLLKEVDRTGTVSLLGFYARRAKRLLPAACVVLAATAVMIWAWVPKIRWEATGGDIVSAALYVLNWRLADRSVDYLQEDVTPSAVQHYWSLSVEEQFYVVWPLLLLGAVLLAARFGVRRRPALLVGLAVVALPSLGWSVWMSIHSPERAYFVTTTRMWEFTVGAAVAILATYFDRTPRPLAIAVSWTGLAMVLLAARIYEHTMTWPGAAALLPILGAGMFIAGGVAAGRHGPVALIGNRFMLFIGYLTYSLYLWHWPLLIVAREHFGSISVPVGLAIVASSIVPAWLTFHLVENPIRSSAFVTKHAKVGLSIGANFTLAGVVAGLALVLGVTATLAPVTGAVAGAAVLSSDPIRDPDGKAARTVSGGIVPDPLQAPKDVPDLYASGCQVSVEDTEPTSCTYGPADARLTIAVVGDSKAAQWVPAFQLLAEQKDWRITTYTKSACQFATVTTSLDGQPYDTCRTWVDNVLGILTGPDRPDVVVTAGQRDSGFDASGALSHDAMRSALVSTWGRLRASGVKVVSLSDTPQTGMEVYACVSEQPDDLTRCTYDKARGISRSGHEIQKAAASQAQVPFVDLTDWICPEERCAPVIGNVLVYRQGSHITKTYIETLAPRLGAELARVGVR
jgi:peptidoglycan/LPS O-acetylase OafA/YrhL